MIIAQPDRILLRQQLARYAPLLSGEVLDIGSGRARRYAHLCPRATAYRTLDTDPAGQPDILASADAIPLPDASVDGIICTQVLEHLPHPWIAVREMARILRPGGHAVITVPQMNDLHEEPHDYFRYTKYGLESLFQDAGLTVETMEQRGKLHATLAQLRIRAAIERFRPYERIWAMLLLAPWAKVVTNIALWRDKHANHLSTAKQTIGWCAVINKP